MSGSARSLGAIAAGCGLTFGTSIAEDALQDEALGTLYRQQSRIFTADWAMKLPVLRPAPGVFDTGAADRLLAYAEAARIPLRGHTMAWNMDHVPWIMKLSAREQATLLDRHVDELAGRYAGRLHSWDVVNEPFWPGSGLPEDYRDGPWWRAFGKGFAVRAFKHTQAADPTARLVLNEAHTEQWTPIGAGIRQRLLRLIDELQHAGVRLDAVGLQGHMQPQWAYDDNGFADFLGQIAARKVDIYITEMDVNDAAFADPVASRDALVAQRYERFVSSAINVPAVKMIITWQLADKASYLWGDALNAKPVPLRKPRPLPFDEYLAPKPAFDGIALALQRR